jgi:putative hydrolase of the HAD superfamily
VSGPGSRPRAVLFDLDDTLFDHVRATRVALEAVQASDRALACWSLDELDRRHRVILEAWHLEVLAGRATIEQARLARFAELLSAAGATAPAEDAVGVAARYRATYETAWFTVPGARELLDAIAADGITIGIVTNNVRVEQELKLRRCALESLSGGLVTSEEVGAQKPDPRIFAVALERLGMQAAEAVMVGDAWGTDIEGALRAGIRPVWLNRFGGRSPNPSVAELSSFEPLAEAWRVIVGTPRA